jgi:protein arginine kinase activator
MKCDLCDAQATVFLTQIVDGQMQKVNLCESCSQEKGVTDPTSFPFTDLLVGLGSTKKVGSSARELSDAKNIRCPGCNFSLSDFKNVGRLGCSRCYETFASELDGLLKAMHKGTRHIGKVPNHLDEMFQLQGHIEELGLCLEKAIADENYEEAASLRDQIENAESHLTEVSKEART